MWRYFSTAFTALKTNKVRSILTIVGIVIGTASVVAVISIALGGKGFVVGQLESLGANLIFGYWEGSGSGTDNIMQETISRYELTMDDMNAVEKEVKGLRYIAPIVWGYTPLFLNGKERQISLIGATPSYKPTRNVVVTAGRFLNNADIRSRAKVCLITPALVKKLFYNFSPIGKYIRVHNLRFAVIGVSFVSSTGGSSEELKQESIIIPITVSKYFTGSNKIDFFYAQAETSGLVSGVTENIKKVLVQRHGKKAEYEVGNLTQILSTVGKITMVLALVIGAIAGISLLVGGVGIMNIMLVTVAERTREIGVRLAVGAKPKDVILQFLAEAVILSGTGGIIGIFLGAGIPLLFGFIFRIATPVSWFSAFIALAVSWMVGIVFGLYPAVKAGRMDPVEALRYE